MALGKDKGLPSSTTVDGRVNNSSMRYEILDNPPWLQSIGLGFQVGQTQLRKWLLRSIGSITRISVSMASLKALVCTASPSK